MKADGIKGQRSHKHPLKKKKKSSVTVIVEAYIFYCKLCPSKKLPKSLILERRLLSLNCITPTYMPSIMNGNQV